METVHLETTFISYLVARPSGDLLVAAHQKTTQDWWATRRDQFTCYTSQTVIDEASAGEPSEAQKRLEVLATLTPLDVTPEAGALGQGYSRQRGAPAECCPRRRACGGGRRTRSRLSPHLELQALGQRTDHAKNRISVSGTRASDA